MTSGGSGEPAQGSGSGSASASASGSGSVAASKSSTRHIPPHEWIADYFGPVITVLASTDAEAVCAKNNLTLCELLQPFSKLLMDVTMKDCDGAVHNVPNLNINFLDFRKDPARMVNQKLLSDLLAENYDEPLVSR